MSNVTFEYYGVFMGIPSVPFIAIGGFQALISVVGNGLILIAIGSYRRLHTTSNIFIANLAVSDFLVGIVVMPMYAVLSTNDATIQKYLHQKNTCLLFNFVINTITGGECK